MMSRGGKEGQVRMKRIIKGAAGKFVWLCKFIKLFIMFDKVVRDENLKAEQRYREQKKI